MKKLLCVLLAAVMLLGFTAIFATANDLQAQGETLLRASFDVFESEAGFTLRGPDGLVITSYGWYYAHEAANTDWPWLFGGRARYFSIPGARGTALPDRHFYVCIRAFLGPHGFRDIIWRGMPEEVEVEAMDGYLRVSFPYAVGHHIVHHFYFEDGQLRRIESPWFASPIDSLEVGAEHSLFDVSGMLRVPFLALNPITLVPVLAFVLVRSFVISIFS